jgi:hypothetical protein
MDDDALAIKLSQMDLEAREALRRALVSNQKYRDAMAERLLRAGATGMAELLDFLTLNPDIRRQAAGGKSTRPIGGE